MLCTMHEWCQSVAGAYIGPDNRVWVYGQPPRPIQRLRISNKAHSHSCPPSPCHGPMWLNPQHSEPYGLCPCSTLALFPSLLTLLIVPTPMPCQPAILHALQSCCRSVSINLQAFLSATGQGSTLLSRAWDVAGGGGGRY